MRITNSITSSMKYDFKAYKKILILVLKYPIVRLNAFYTCAYKIAI